MPHSYLEHGFQSQRRQRSRPRLRLAPHNAYIPFGFQNAGRRDPEAPCKKALDCFQHIEKSGDPSIDPRILEFKHYSGDPQKITSTSETPIC